MARLYVIAGHGAGDPGAGGFGMWEAERVRALALRIKELGGDEVELHDMSDDAYSSGALNWVDVGGAQVVELHMDSGPEGARGGHVIYCGRLEPDAFDAVLAREVGAIFPGRASTLVGRTDLANPNRAAARGIPYRLVENGFISNRGDLEAFGGRMDELARAYLRAFGIGEAPAQDPPQESPAQGGPAPETGDDGDFHGGAYRCTVDGLRIRRAPSLSGEVVAGVSYGTGDVVVLDDWYEVADGWVWGRYTGASSGEPRYVAVGRATGSPEPDDYLVRA